MDPLDEVFSAMRVENALYARLEAKAPWGLSTRRGETTRFGLVLRGGCWLTLDDGSRHAPIALSAGDCFVVPQGSPYILQDDFKSPTVSCVDVVQRNMGGVVQLGGGGATTTIISGWFVFDADGARPLLDLLPPLLHIRMDQDRTQLLQSTLQLLSIETAQRGLGSGLVVSRLADIIFVQVMRTYIATLNPDSDSGWLAALSDRRIGPALQLIHDDVAASWTVDKMASAIGMSRSAFAMRFREKVGQSPLDYLTRWRMFRASHLLRSTDKSLSEIAACVGYESEAAFNKAFKRAIGLSPGAYRKVATRSGSGNGNTGLVEVTLAS